MSRKLEAIAQTNLFRFYQNISGQVPAVQWAFHVPNGGHRHIAVAAQLKAQGVKAGVPDILIPVPSVIEMDSKTSALFKSANQLYPPVHYVGLAIELKVGVNKPSEDQRTWQARFQQSGWRAVISYGWEAAALETLLYFKQDPAKFYLF